MATTSYDDSITSPWNLQQKASGRITEVTSPGPYFGTKLTQYECRDGDNQTFAGTSASAKRCEKYLNSQTTNSYDGVTQWVAFMIVGISGTVPTGDWSFRHQWHGPNGTGQAQIIINTPGGKLNVRCWDCGTNQQFNFNALTSAGASITFANGTPYYFLQRIVWSVLPSVGRLEMWCNGVKFVDKAFQTIYTQTSSGAALNGTERRAYIKDGFYASNGGGTVVTASDGHIFGTSSETFATMSALFPVSSGFPGASGGGGSGGGTSAAISFLTPADNATVIGRVDWEADATDPTGIVSVAFKVDGATVLTETSAPYGDTAGFWDSTTVADGSHTLTVTSTNGSGGTLSTSRTVTVDNATDPGPDVLPGTDNRYHKINDGSKGSSSKVAGSKTGGTKFTQAAQAAEEESATLGSTAILDTFTRANEGPPPSSSWTTGIVSTDGGLKVVSNECQGNTSTNNSGYWNPLTPGPDCEAYVTLNNGGNDGSWCYLWIRATNVATTTPSGYILRFDKVASAQDTLRIYKVVSGSHTQIGSTYSFDQAVNDRILLRAVSDTITAGLASQTGAFASVIEVTDATHSSAGRIGLYCRGATQDFINFGGGDV